jgi:Carboxypeptidase regulatory-like domain
MRSPITLLVFLTLGIGYAFGQGNTGSILGTVTDPTGAVVPGADVVATNVKTGVQSNAVTDGLGNYLIQFLQPGAYRLEVGVPGFKKFVRESLNLEMTRQLRIDVSLETGVVTETVSIEASTPLLETETGALSTTIENTQVTSLPLLGRNPQEFRLLVPGVVLNRDGNTVTQGGLVRKDPYYIDGSHSSNHVWSGNPVNPNPDVLQEFKVLTNSFSAEWGETSGAIMASITRSGTNDFHGTLFEFLRNDKLNAGEFFTHTRPILRRNQFGGTVGGPIRKNKTFFFFDLQFTRQRGTQPFTNFTVPIGEFRRGDFSRILGAQIGTDALGRPVLRNQIFDPLTTRTVGEIFVRDPFPENRIPTARLSPAALKIQELYPAAQVDTPFANFTSFGSTKTNNYEYDIKIDHHFSQNDKVMVRYSRRQFDTDQPAAFPDPRAGGFVGLGPGFSKSPGRQGALNHVHIFGTRATNSLHISWFQVFPKRAVPGYGVVGTEDLGIMGLPNGKEKLGTPEFRFTNFNFLGSTGDTLFFELQNSNGLVNVASVISGRHNIKFGGEARLIRTDNFQPNPGNTRWTFSNIFTDQRGFAATGFDYATFLLGLPAQLGYRIFPDYFRSRGSVYALFIQDDIRISRKLTLNLGLRWDAPLWYHERDNRSGVFDLDKGEYVQLGTNGFRNTPWKNDWNNFGPRFGFAYSPFDNSKTVIRGGYGIFSVGTMSSGAFGFLLADPIFADADVGRYNTLDQVNWATTLDRVPYELADKTGRNATAVSVFPEDNPMSYFQQWNLNVEQEVKGVMLEVGYAGSRGVHLHYGGYNANAIPLHLAPEARGRRIAPFVRYPQYPGGVTINSWIGSSYFHAFQFKAEKRFSGGLGFLAAYTFQKTIDVGQVGYRDPLNNRNLDRGVGPDSAPQRFTIAYSYSLPFGTGRRWLTKGPLTHLLGGWELNGITTLQSGFPLTPGLSTDSCVCGSILRPDLVGDPKLSGSDRSLDRWFNVGAFAQPALYTVGNAGRSLFYGPGLVNFDLSIAKRFYIPQLTEGSNVEFRAEFYNLTNTPYFDNPNTTIGAGTAGRITRASGSARQGQMALKFHW